MEFVVSVSEVTARRFIARMFVFVFPHLCFSSSRRFRVFSYFRFRGFFSLCAVGLFGEIVC